MHQCDAAEARSGGENGHPTYRLRGRYDRYARTDITAAKPSRALSGLARHDATPVTHLRGNVLFQTHYGRNKLTCRNVNVADGAHQTLRYKQQMDAVLCPCLWLGLTRSKHSKTEIHKNINKFTSWFSLYGWSMVSLQVRPSGTSHAECCSCHLHPEDGIFNAYRNNR
jgi:hypothetical protein